MASSSSTQASRAPARAPSAADNAHLRPQPSRLNPEFVAMPATELVAYLERHGRASDFADAALVFSDRERRLADAEDLVRQQCDVIHALQQPRAAEAAMVDAQQQPRAGDAMAHAALQQPRAAEATGRDMQQPRASNARARALLQPRAANAKARARHGSGTSGRGGDVVPARKKPYRALRASAAPGFPISSDDENEGDTASSDEGDEVRDDVPRHGSLRMNASTGYKGRSALQAKQPRQRR